MINMKLLILILLIFKINNVLCQSAVFKGTLISEKSGYPIQLFFAEIGMQESPIDSLGRFVFSNLELGKKYQLTFIPNLFEDQVIEFVIDSLITEKILMLNPICDFNEKQALLDIENNEPRLLLTSGFFSIPPTENSASFERKYGVRYLDTGCQRILNSCSKEYNTIIFQYLDLKFGKYWRTEVREDVLHLTD